MTTAEVPQSLCLIMRRHLPLECSMNLKILTKLRDFLQWDLIHRHLSLIKHPWDVRTFRTHHDIDRHRMIPGEPNRAIFKILQRASGESVQCILIYHFGERLVGVWTGWFASKRYYEVIMHEQEFATRYPQPACNRKCTH